MGIWLNNTTANMSVGRKSQQNNKFNWTKLRIAKDMQAFNKFEKKNEL